MNIDLRIILSNAVALIYENSKFVFMEIQVGGVLELEIASGNTLEECIAEYKHRKGVPKQRAYYV